MARHPRQRGEPKTAPRARIAAVAGLLALGAIAAVCVAGLLIDPAGRWFFRAVTSRLSLLCAAMLVVLGAAFAVLAGVLWQAGRPCRGKRGGEDGVAMIEFVLVLPFLLMLSLLMAQTSLLMVGNLCVHYSAFCAARTAVVTVPKDFGAGEPRNLMRDFGDETSKLYRVKTAAAWAVMPVSCDSEEIPPSDDVLPNGVSRFFGVQGIEPPIWADARLARRYTYAMDHTEISVAPPVVDDDDDDEYYDEHEDIHVTVQHTLYLSVPTAARIFAMLPGGVELEFGSGEYGTVITAACTLPNEGAQDYVDIEEFP